MARRLLRNLWFALLLYCSMAGAAGAAELAIIVHPDRKAELGLDEIAQIFLKKRRFWPDGERIVPVNQESASAIRKVFARSVLRAEGGALVVYWNRQYFQGVLPPATFASDQAVLRFVGSEPRAIGYVHPSVLNDSVRVIFRVNDPGSNPATVPATRNSP